MRKNTNGEQETGQGATHDPEALPEIVRVYDSLIYAGRTIMQMTQIGDKNTISALAKAHRAVVDARQALLPMVADAMKAVKP